MSIGDLAGSLGIQGSTDLTTFKVKVGGQKLDGIVTFAIDSKINSIPTAYVLLDDGDVAKQDFEKSGKSNLDPGSKVEITLGYQNLEATVFKGVLVRQNIKISRSGGSRLELICKDPSYRMTLAVNSKYFKDVKDEDIFEELADGYSGVSVNVKKGVGSLLTTKYDEVVQHDISDWDFLIARAEQAGMFVTVEDGEIKVQGAPLMILPDVTVSYGGEIMDLDLELDSDSQYQNYKALAWSDERQEIIEEESGPGKYPDPGSSSASELADVGESDYIIRHGGQIKTEQLKGWATAKKFKSELCKIRGTVSFQGTPKAKPGASIKLKGLGKRFNGMTIITGVSHEIVNNSWITTAQVGFNPEWHFEKHTPGAQADKLLAGSITGLHAGIVKQIHQDPDGRERLLINMPLIDPDGEGTWMRWTSLDASETKGFVCRPDVDDEVVVGFLNGDSNQGVVLGAMYSKVNPGSTSLAAEEGNYKKGWVLKENLHVIFDTENDNIEIVTPGGHSIKISDEDAKITITDSNQNEIVMDDNGMSFTTQGDFTVSAQGDVKLEGMNVELTAQTGFKGAGTTAEINGSGQTTIKGNPVNIN